MNRHDFVWHKLTLGVIKRAEESLASVEEVAFVIWHAAVSHSTLEVWVNELVMPNITKAGPGARVYNVHHLLCCEEELVLLHFICSNGKVAARYRQLDLRRFKLIDFFVISQLDNLDGIDSFGNLHVINFPLIKTHSFHQLRVTVALILVIDDSNDLCLVNCGLIGQIPCELSPWLLLALDSEHLLSFRICLLASVERFMSIEEDKFDVAWID